MKISIFGMGYVGSTTAACLLDDGHEVIGVDIDHNKVGRLNKGKAPMIKEEGLKELLSKGHRENRLWATRNICDRVLSSDIIFVCVGTPSKFDGSIDLCFVEKVIKDIGSSLKGTKYRPLIVVRSTCLPGTMNGRVRAIFEKNSGLSIDEDIDVLFHPEFLREGVAIDDFKNPPKIVIGQSRPGASDLLLKLYEDYDAPVFELTFGEAEMIKYCDNIFHALKITFANEMAIISDSIGVDSRKVAEVYCADTKLNISKEYLMPGFAYGGSCLPKDLKAVLRFAELKYLQLPMLKGIEDSNNRQIRRFIERIISEDPSNVGIVGIAFKKGTDDIRNSPHVEVAKSLIGEGINVKIYDPLVNQDALIGSNKRQFYKSFKNMDSMMVSSLEKLSDSNVIIINHNIVDSGVIKKWTNKGIKVIDIAGINGIDKSTDGYEGLFW